MRWSYKTVHYDLKKEGLLGGTFIDESEIELSLNEYGKVGWELVSILETQEGLLAVFKQLIAIAHQGSVTEEKSARSRVVLRPQSQQDDRFAEVFVEEPAEAKAGRVREMLAPVEEEYEIVVEEAQAKKRQEGDSEDDIGTIRIE